MYSIYVCDNLIDTTVAVGAHCKKYNCPTPYVIHYYYKTMLFSHLTHVLIQ